jgi:hypothetical protein
VERVYWVGDWIFGGFFIEGDWGICIGKGGSGMLGEFSGLTDLTGSILKRIEDDGVDFFGSI